MTIQAIWDRIEAWLKQYAPEDSTVFLGTQTMTSRLEMPSDGAKGGEKALGLLGGREAPHFLLAQTRGLVRIFCSVVQSFVLWVLYAR